MYKRAFLHSNSPTSSQQILGTGPVSVFSKPIPCSSRGRASGRLKEIVLGTFQRLRILECLKTVAVLGPWVDGCSRNHVKLILKPRENVRRTTRIMFAKPRNWRHSCGVLLEQFLIGVESAPSWSRGFDGSNVKTTSSCARFRRTSI